MKEQQVERASRIAALIVKRMQESLSPEEQAELEAWLREDSENYLLYEELMDEKKLGAELSDLQTIDQDSAWNRLSDHFFRSTPVLKPDNNRTWYYAAAAILVLSISAFLLYFELKTKPGSTAPMSSAQQDYEKIKPGGKKATLTLADGSTIELDQDQQGVLAQQGNTVIQQSHPGALYYSGDNSHSFTSKPQQNTLTVPRSGEYSVTLDDGTIVWLNALSTLRFPVNFPRAERRVQLVGEAYFQVAKDAARPFIVEVDSVEVRALGTEFNITAYPDENKMQAALVEGLVKVTRKNESHLLQPGKKAEIPDFGKIEIQDADIEEVTAWKKGEFVFHNTSFSSIMNQLIRWYDIEVIYPEGIPSINFTGGLRRADGIYKLIQMLELTGEVRFEVADRKILAYPTRHAF